MAREIRPKPGLTKCPVPEASRSMWPLYAAGFTTAFDAHGIAASLTRVSQIVVANTEPDAHASRPRPKRRRRSVGAAGRRAPGLAQRSQRPGAAADIAAWVTDCGPGLADPPGVLDLYTFQASLRVRHELEADPPSRSITDPCDAGEPWLGADVMTARDRARPAPSAAVGVSRWCQSGGRA
jgi:hypothetical protein